MERALLSQPLQVCLVGAGRMGSIRSPILYANPDVDFAYVVDANIGAANILANKYRASACTSLADVFSRSVQLQTFVVSTPTFTHVSIVKKICELNVARRGTSKSCFVFIEKPVAETANEIWNLFEVARQSNVHICCGFQRRFDPSYTKVRDEILRGKIGKVHCARIFFADHPVPPTEFLVTGGDPFMDLAPHDVDYLRWVLASEPKQIWAQGSSSTPELSRRNVFDNAGISFVE